MKGVAPANAPDSQPGPPDYSMFFNSLAGIFRAGGKKPAAMPQKRAERRLIKADKSHQYFIHGCFHLVRNSLCQYIFNLNQAVCLDFVHFSGPPVSSACPLTPQRANTPSPSAPENVQSRVYCKIPFFAKVAELADALP